jgi:cadmium resistance protein CadD (predicted permease)
LALAIPEGWVALLGVVPVLLGISKLLALRTDTVVREDGSDEHRIQEQEHNWAATIILSGRRTTMMAGGEESKAA